MSLLFRRCIRDDEEDIENDWVFAGEAVNCSSNDWLMIQETSGKFTYKDALSANFVAPKALISKETMAKKPIGSNLKDELSSGHETLADLEDALTFKTVKNPKSKKNKIKNKNRD